MDDFDLDELDVESAEQAVRQRLDEEAARTVEVEDEDGCAGGACKI